MNVTFNNLSSLISILQSLINIQEISSLTQTSNSATFVKRKRTFSESLGLSNQKNTQEKLAAKSYEISQMSKDIINSQIKECNPEIHVNLKESTEENDSQSSLQPSNNNNEDSKSKSKKVTQAQLMGKTAGRWTKEEHKKFVQAIKLYGKDWKKVEEYVSSRSGAQIRSHAQKYFIRIQKKLKGNSATYLNQTEDQCNTTKGLELFRQTIALYEEGAKDDPQDDDDDLTCLNTLKRQKLSSSSIQFESPRMLGIPLNQEKRSEFFTSETPFLISQKDSQMQLLNLQQELGVQLSTQISDSNKPQIGNSSSFFLLNEVNISNVSYILQKKQIQLKFYEIVKRKEMITTDIYFNEKADLFNDGRKYITLIQDILSDIQKLSQKLTIINQSKQFLFQSQTIVSGLLDPTNNTTSLLERLLILINEVVNLQKVLTELVNNNESFNKPIQRTPSIFQTPTTTQTQSPFNNINLMSLVNQLTPPQSQSFNQNQSSQSTAPLSQFSAIIGLQNNKPVQSPQLAKQDQSLSATKIKPIYIIKHKENN